MAQRGVADQKVEAANHQGNNAVTKFRSRSLER